MLQQAMLPPRPFEVTSSADADAAVDEFEATLGRKGIRIAPGSELEHACLAIKRYHDAHLAAKRGEAPSGWQRFRDDLQLGIGVLNLAQLVVSLAESPEFAKLVPHLRLLNDGAPAQTRRARLTDQASNKIFELRLALACLATGSDLSLDDPLASSDGKNPDVLCRMRDGRLWGFACKVLHGDAPMTLFERFVEGIEQIERSPADVGLVCVSLKNRLPHEEVFPILGKAEDGDEVLGALPTYHLARTDLSRIVQNRVDGMVRHVGLDAVANELRNRKTLPGICCPVEAVISVAPPGSRSPIPTILSYLHTVRTDWGVPKRLDRQAELILADVNLGLAKGRSSNSSDSATAHRSETIPEDA